MKIGKIKKLVPFPTHVSCERCGNSPALNDVISGRILCSVCRETVDLTHGSSNINLHIEPEVIYPNEGEVKMREWESLSKGEQEYIQKELLGIASIRGTKHLYTEMLKIAQKKFPVYRMKSRLECVKWLSENAGEDEFGWMFGGKHFSFSWLKSCGDVVHLDFIEEWPELVEEEIV